MAGIITSRNAYALAILLCSQIISGCVSTEALYAEYDAVDCLLIVHKDSVVLHEKISKSQLPWEPAVYFDYDSSELSAAEVESLKTSLKVLRLYPSLALSLQGFTDSLGNANYNMKLAQRRISTVKTYLEQEGIAPTRIFLQPIGKALPQIDRDDASTHAINRRVELMLLDETGKPMTVQYALD